MNYLLAFTVGGLICAIGQLLVDKTQMTPARILTMYVIVGVLLSALGLYGPLVKWAGAGATVPLTGFGHLLAKGVQDAVHASGALGIFTGGLRASAAGICCAVLSAILAAVLFRAKAKQ
ncbi:MAG: stage V sporulation protein AE [Selenomonas sp.]|nr:stage V sporulation protein AE [Selenomonas sp.]